MSDTLISFLISKSLICGSVCQRLKGMKRTDEMLWVMNLFCDLEPFWLRNMAHIILAVSKYIGRLRITQKNIPPKVWTNEWNPRVCLREFTLTNQKSDRILAHFHFFSLLIFLSAKIRISWSFRWPVGRNRP